ncbi:MAG: class I SAM-dependent methyltransferase [Saprospiraceae bacterium]|nr:class I SAM-dependent methyltransferase [Saprospiraceae bacterium]
MIKRRNNLPFDPLHFEKQAQEGQKFNMRETFEWIYRSNHWSAVESVSGQGSERSQTAVLEAVLPPLLEQLQVATLLDAPCGDFAWMQHLDLPIKQYIGADLVPELIAKHKALYESPQRYFTALDVSNDPLPVADLLLCRDCLVHFSFSDIFKTLDNIKRSGISYMLTTTFPDCADNEDIVTGDWRVLNLELAPFHFPPPITMINENCTEGKGLYADKSLGLWRIAELC